MTIKELETAIQMKKVEAVEAQLKWQAELEIMDSLQEEMDLVEDRLLDYRDQIVPAAFNQFEKLAEEHNELVKELDRRTQGLAGAKLPYPVPMTCG